MSQTKITHNQIKSVTTLTSADILDLHNTPIEIAPTPGAGKAALPYLITLAGFNTGETPYSSGNSMIIKWGANDPTGGNYTVGSDPFNASDSTVSLADQSQLEASALVMDDVENQPLMLTVDSAFTGGTGTAKVTVYYNIVDLA